MSSEELNHWIVAIDGPAGVGKSSVARCVAGELRFEYLDTGAMYRAVTLACLRAGLLTNHFDERAVTALLKELPLSVEPQGKLRLGEEQVDEVLRTEDVTRHVSAVSAHPEVRAHLLQMQRETARRLVDPPRGIVVDGRDIGSNVFPKARFRFFLDATIDERARRRWLQEKKTESLETYVAKLRMRDEFDKNRTLAPMRIAEGAVVLDTTDMAKKEVVSRIVRTVQR